MAELKAIQELLSTGMGTEGQLLIPRKIHDTLIEEVDKNLIPRSEAAMYFGPTEISGSSYDVDLVAPNEMDIRIVAEGAEIPIDQAAYTDFNLKPVKWGVAIRITRELLEDAKWNMLAHTIKVAGKRFAEKETELIIAALTAGVGSTITGGAAFTIGNLTEAMLNIENEDYTPTDMICGNEVICFLI